MRAANVGIYLRLYKRLTVFSWQALKILATFAVRLLLEKEKVCREAMTKFDRIAKYDGKSVY